jgi:hypothetical protein
VTAQPRPSTGELGPGTALGKYEILRKLATGGMAEIYLARVRGAAGFEKLVVVKRILPSAAEDPAFVQMFLDEARLAATLQGCAPGAHARPPRSRSCRHEQARRSPSRSGTERALAASPAPAPR